MLERATAPSRPGDAGAAAEADILMRVDHRRPVADDVLALTLASVDPSDLPHWTPGAHIDLILPCGLTRQYSLCGNPADRERWTVAVLRDSAGRGGSEFVHDSLPLGATVRVRGPRNRFPLVDAERYVLIAGGIGVTPILPMIRQLAAAGADWHLHYGGRRRSSMAFRSELDHIDSYRVRIYAEDEVGLIDLESALGRPAEATAVYCCGPIPLLNAVAAYGRQWPAEALHVESFVPQKVGESAGEPGTFEVELARSGVTVSVPPGVSILDAVEAAGVPARWSCREGICGTCQTTVLSGEVDHRDSLLTHAERKSNATMFICVSRARTSSLIIDL